MIDKFEMADNKGRNLFSAFCESQTWCKIKKFAKAKDPYDVSYTSGDTKIIGEIKFRNFPSTAFPDWLMQQHKIKDITVLKNKVDTKYPNDKNCRIQFIIFYTDGIVQIWDITDIEKEQTPVDTIVTKTTFGDTSKVHRQQFLLYNNNVILRKNYE